MKLNEKALEAAISEAVQKIFNGLELVPQDDLDRWIRRHNDVRDERDEARRLAAENGKQIAALREALNERDLFINPDVLDKSADEIDCGSACTFVWRENDTNASGCSRSEAGEYCPNDVAETLRAVAKVARADLAKAREV